MFTNPQFQNSRYHRCLYCLL